MEPETDGGSDITDYHIEVRESFHHAWQRIATTSARDKLTYTATKLINGQQYTYRVAAENSMGVSTYCEMVAPITAKSKHGEFLQLFYNSIYSILFT